MAPQQSNFLIPDATFFVELVTFVLLVLGAIWLLVRALRRRSVTDELAMLGQLRDTGVLTDGELEQRKASLLR